MDLREKTKEDLQKLSRAQDLIGEVAGGLQGDPWSFNAKSSLGEVAAYLEKARRYLGELLKPTAPVQVVTTTTPEKNEENNCSHCGNPMPKEKKICSSCGGSPMDMS